MGKERLASGSVGGAPGFRFRGVHPRVFLGTASDRYAGWLGQVYSPERWGERITLRRKEVGGEVFTERVLPVESVAEYFEHFPLLELDSTFYRPLREWDGRPSDTHLLLERYARHLGEGDLLLLKAPQAVTARTLRRGGATVPNDDYLDRDLFVRRFLEPARRILGGHLAGVILEQEYQRKSLRQEPEEVARELDAFLGGVGGDTPLHVELRTAAYLAPPVMEVLAARGAGQVLSHWTWLPHLPEQFRLAGERFLPAGGAVVVRLMTPHGVRYEEAFARAFPFAGLVEGMASPTMVEDTARLARQAADQGLRAYVVINNRAGGNAPLIAEQVAERLGEQAPA